MLALRNVMYRGVGPTADFAPHLLYVWYLAIVFMTVCVYKHGSCPAGPKMQPNAYRYAIKESVTSLLQLGAIPLTDHEKCTLYRNTIGNDGSETASCSPSLKRSFSLRSRFGLVCSSKLAGLEK